MKWFTICRRIGIWLLVLVVLAAGWGAYRILVLVRGIPDAYAAKDTGDLIVEYLKTHDGNWPRSWDDLATGARFHPELPSRVKIDFSADPEEIARTERQGGDPPVHVVTRSDGTDFPVVWSGHEPNAMIWQYLRENEKGKGN